MVDGRESPGAFKDFPGTPAEYDTALNNFRLYVIGAIPDLAGLRVLEVPQELQTLPMKQGE